MNSIYNIISHDEVKALPLHVLKEIAIILKLDEKSNADELAFFVWKKIKDDMSARKFVLEPFKSLLLCGRTRTSVTWFRFPKRDVSWVIPAINEALNGDLFSGNAPIDGNADISIVSGASGINEEEYILIYRVKEGGKHQTTATGDLEYVPKMTRIPVIFNAKYRTFEIRSSYRIATRITEHFMELVRRPESIVQIDIMSLYKNNVEKIADELGGRLIDSSVRMEYPDIEISGAMTNTFAKILTALDRYLSGNDDITDLKQTLDDAKASNNEFENMPIISLLMAKIGTLKMGVDNGDLREVNLYEHGKPYMQNQSALIRIADIFAPTKEYTIQVGVSTKNIVFLNATTEDMINFVREKLMGQLLKDEQ